MLLDVCAVVPLDVAALLWPAVPRTADEVLVDGAVLTAVLLAVVLPVADALDTLFAVLLLTSLRTVADEPRPPLDDVRLANTLSEPVSCLGPLHTSLPWWSGTGWYPW